MTPVLPNSGEADGLALIAAERERQVAAEGWTPEHDDQHRDGGLAYAAACYAMPERIYVARERALGPAFDDPWPWKYGDKRKRQSNFPNAIPTDGDERLRMLVKAGALIAAEIDRLQRIPPRPNTRGGG